MKILNNKMLEKILILMIIDVLYIRNDPYLILFTIGIFEIIVVMMMITSNRIITKTPILLSVRTSHKGVSTMLFSCYIMRISVYNI
jgi:hypothetical protein